MRPEGMGEWWAGGVWVGMASLCRSIRTQELERMSGQRFLGPLWAGRQVCAPATGCGRVSGKRTQAWGPKDLVVVCFHFG